MLTNKRLDELLAIVQPDEQPADGDKYVGIVLSLKELCDVLKAINQAKAFVYLTQAMRATNEGDKR